MVITCANPALRLGTGGWRAACARTRPGGSARACACAFRDLDDLAARADLDRATLDLLAEAAALRSLAGHRHRRALEHAGTERQLPLFAQRQRLRHAAIHALPVHVSPTPAGAEPRPPAHAPSRSRASRSATERVREHPRRLRQHRPQPRHHPVALVRRQLQERRYLGSDDWRRRPMAARPFAGLVILRQRLRPPAASPSSPSRTNTAWSTWWSGTTSPSASDACCWSPGLLASMAGWNRTGQPAPDRQPAGGPDGAAAGLATNSRDFR